MNDTLTAIDGVWVWHAHDQVGLTDCTAVLFEQRCGTSVSVGGGLSRTYNVGALMNA